MFALLNRFFDLVMMRLPPQAFPASRFLFGLVVVAFFAAALTSNLLVSDDIFYTVKRALLSVLNLCAGAALILMLANRRARWLQTATALLGGETVLIVFMLPVLIAYAMDISNVFIAISQWLLIIWELVFLGHVYRNALDSGMGAGIAIALIYVIASAVIKQTFVPFPAGAG